jgi:hypothetical protein
MVLMRMTQAALSLMDLSSEVVCLCRSLRWLSSQLFHVCVKFFGRIAWSISMHGTMGRHVAVVLGWGGLRLLTTYVDSQFEMRTRKTRPFSAQRVRARTAQSKARSYFHRPRLSGSALWLCHHALCFPRLKC